MLTIQTTTTHRLTIPDTDIAFDIEGPAPDPHDDAWVHDVAGDEGSAAYEVAWLVHDDHAYDLWEWDDPDTDPSGWVNGCFRDFRNSRDGGGQDARDDFYRQMVEAVGAERVFVVEVYSHGLESFSVVGAKWHPDRQWDVAPACVLAVPPDVTNPREWADGVMESYTAWANGDCWLIVTNRVTERGEVVDYDLLGGLIGREYAEQAAANRDY